MYIKTTDNLPTGDANNLILFFGIKDDIYFVEDTADLADVNYTVDTNDYQDILNERCRELLKATDWYDIRKAGTGQEPPATVTELRDKLRELIQGVA